MNYIKTMLLMSGLVVMFGLIGNAIGGRQGMIMALGFAVAMNFFSYWFSDKMVLSSYGAKPIAKNQAPELYDAVRRLSKKAGLPMPKVYIINEQMPNAFATGRNPDNAVVAVTAGLMKMLNQNELEAVLAHELSHVKHRDILTATIAATAAGAITVLATVGRWAMIFGGGRGDNAGLSDLLMLILAPIAAVLVQMMISRNMEYHADRKAAAITGRPQDLISALERIHAGVKEGVRKRVPTHASPSNQHMLIASPFLGGMLGGLFSTHPSLEQRRAALRKLM